MSVTISYKESSKGWVSFKSFIPETGVSVSNNYFTFKDGKIWQHAIDNAPRNTFYDQYSQSSVEFMLNDQPGLVKSYKALNYEGSQSRVLDFDTVIYPGAITGTYGDNEYYNINGKQGWYTDFIITDMQEGSIKEFIQKEGKWFNHIKGIKTNLSNLDTNEFSVQGIGRLMQMSIVDEPNANQTFTLSSVPDSRQLFGNEGSNVSVGLPNYYVSNSTPDNIYDNIRQQQTNDVVPYNYYINTYRGVPFDAQSYTISKNVENVPVNTPHSGNSIFYNLRFDRLTIKPKSFADIFAANFYVNTHTYGNQTGFVHTFPLTSLVPKSVNFPSHNNPSPHGEEYITSNVSPNSILYNPPPGLNISVPPSPNPTPYLSEKVMIIDAIPQGTLSVGDKLIYKNVTQITFFEQYDVSSPTPGKRYPYPDRIIVEVLYTNDGWNMPPNDYEIKLDIKQKDFVIRNFDLVTDVLFYGEPYVANQLEKADDLDEEMAFMHAQYSDWYWNYIPNPTPQTVTPSPTTSGTNPATTSYSTSVAPPRTLSTPYNQNTGGSSINLTGY